MVEHLHCLQGNGFKVGPGFHLLLYAAEHSRKEIPDCFSRKKGKLSPTYRAGKAILGQVWLHSSIFYLPC